MTPEVPPLLAEVLRKPPVPQRAFPWKPAAWRKEMHDLPDVLQVLDELPPQVDRSIVRETVLAELEGRRILPAFVSAMVWGHGDTGYGPTRVRWALTGVDTGVHDAPIRGDIAGILATAAEIVRAEGPVEGFRYMSNARHIKYLASAFFTKWLYFASALAGADDPNAAPILDKQVHDGLEKQADLSLDISRTLEYERYVNTLAHWGDPFGRTPVQVEKPSSGWQPVEIDRLSDAPNGSAAIVDVGARAYCPVDAGSGFR